MCLIIETMYMRRRALLLQYKAANSTGTEETGRRAYLQLRSTILYQRYGIPKEVLCSSRSRSVSLRGMNMSTSENKNSLGSLQDERYMAVQEMLDHVSLKFVFMLHTILGFWCQLLSSESTQGPFPISLLPKMTPLSLLVHQWMAVYPSVKSLHHAKWYTPSLAMQPELQVINAALDKFLSNVHLLE